MADIKNIAKETAIYGVSSIFGKFLNWLLVPLYTYVLASSADYGIVTNLYAWTALLLIVLTYGMETGFFRFANKQSTEADANKVYTTTLLSIFVTSVLFTVLAVFFSETIANSMGYPQYPEFITMLAIVVAMDAVGSIPFAYLRYKKKPIVFASLKLLMIFSNIIFNLFFLLRCPYIFKHNPEWISWFYNPHYGVGYVFVSNLLSTTIVTLALIPYILVDKFRFDVSLLRQMLRYSIPLLALGIVGIMNQTVDKIIFPFLFEDRMEGNAQLGIYGACFKVAMVMMMFTQAFRFAYEPFVFAKNKDKDSTSSYADIMKFYVIVSLFIFLGMMFYLDVLKWIIREDYWEGLVVVPIVLISYLFQGVYFNLSLWYKLTDKTHYGAYLSTIGFVLNTTLIIVFVPKYGYVAAAWASLFSYLCIMIVSYIVGQRFLPINYDIRAIATYFFIALALYFVSIYIQTQFAWLNYLLKSVLLGGFLLYTIKRDVPLSSIPILNKWFRKK
jgi:O-antigen/teichoic acid export membrane protein